MSQLLRIAIDMDGVIADLVPKQLACYNRDFQQNLTLTDLHGKKLRQLVKNPQAVMSYYDEPDFFRDLKVIEGSQETIRALQSKYEIFISTAAMEVPHSFQAKYQWLKEHFAFIPDTHIVFCGDKSIIHADYLIDDNSSHFAGFKGKGILFTAPHNVYEEGHIRVNHWRDVAQMFLD
jgi:5'(3')-deoxyribonucleotidase